MYQKITILGNLGADPESVTIGESQCTRFPVATNRKYGDGQEETTWFRITAWGRLGETCAMYLAKGKAVLVEGRLTPDPITGGPRVWTRQDGEGAASFDVHATEVRFVS